MNLRDEVRQYLKDNKESFVQEVYNAAGHLNLVPLARTVVGCLKVLGDRFSKVTKDEIIVAVFVVQMQCAHSKRSSERAEPD